MKIGIFDSGVAGLTVVRSLHGSLPARDLCYLGDTAGFPYGIKSPSTIARRLQKGLDWLVDQGVAAIAIVCASAAAVHAAGLVGNPAVALAGTVAAAVPEAVTASRSGRIGVLGTAAVSQTEVFPKLIQGTGIRVIETDGSLLEALVMAGWSRRAETRRIVKKVLYPLKRRQIDTLVVVSTAGLVLAPVVREKIGARVVVVDGGQALVRRLKDEMGHPRPFPGEAPGRLACWLTDTAPAFTAMAQKIHNGRLAVLQAPHF